MIKFVLLYNQTSAFAKQEMKISKLKYLTLALVFSLCQLAMSQSNPNLVRDRVVNAGGTATKYNFSIESSALPTPAQNEEYSNVSGFNYINASSSPYEFQVLITPNFLGTATFAMEWYAPTTTIPFIKPMVTFYEIEVVQSIIDTEIDVITIEEGTPSVEIYPTTNDFAEFAPLTLLDVSHVMYGNAEVTDSNTIIYTPGDHYQDYVMYTVNDTIGESCSGKIIINVLDSLAEDVDTLLYTITDIESQVIVLPFGDLEQSQSPAQGSLEYLSDHAYRYTPELGSLGIDTIVFDNSLGKSRVVLLEVYPISSEPSYAVDDQYFTAVGETVLVYPLENDIKSTFPISDISEDLEYISPGVYSFTPSENFTGLKSFDYTINYGFGSASAKINISVGNYVPQSTFAYNFVTAKDQPLVIKYDIPLEGYELISDVFNTSHGFVTTYGEEDNVTVGCNQVNGEAFFIYYPSPNYIGLDNFDIEYCINGECFIYTIEVEVIDVTSDECFCVNDCVWEGDTDGNGRVNVSDLLPIGRHMGVSGSTRQSLYEFWSAEDTDNWTYNQPNGKNIKHADANGDGIVTVADTNSISEYYNQLNNFVPNEVLAIKNYPFFLVPHSTEVDSGELMILDIVLGTVEFPVKDLHGLAFSIQVGGGFADSASLFVDLYEDSWLTNVGPSIQMSKKPSNGLIETALSRTDGIPSSGYGIIGQLGFIVEDEAAGFKDDDGEVYFGVRLRGAVGESAAGSSYYMPEAGVRIQYLNNAVGKDVEDTLVDMVVSPNPARDMLHIELPNASEEILNLYLTDITGKVISTDNSSSSSLNLNSIPMGMYILSVKTDVSSYVQKIQVVK